VSRHGGSAHDGPTKSRSGNAEGFRTIVTVRTVFETDNVTVSLLVIFGIFYLNRNGLKFKIFVSFIFVSFDACDTDFFVRERIRWNGSKVDVFYGYAQRDMTRSKGTRRRRMSDNSLLPHWAPQRLEIRFLIRFYFVKVVSMKNTSVFKYEVAPVRYWMIDFGQISV